MPRSVSGEETSRIGPPLLPGTGKRCTDGTRPEPSSDGLPAGFTPVAIIGDRGESVCTARSFSFRRVPGDTPSRGNAPKKEDAQSARRYYAPYRKAVRSHGPSFPAASPNDGKPDNERQNGPKSPAISPANAIRPCRKSLRQGRTLSFGRSAFPSFTPLSGRRRDYQPST